MTRNEAAALATIAHMGWETFTIRMLQQATGLSYHQVRRILQGYTARGTTYCGLLEKCPALGVVDATVLDESTGTVVRRHELHFQFDAERYREWVAQAVVWLEDDSPPPPDPGCNDGCNDGCNEIGGDDYPQAGGESRNRDVLAGIDSGDQGSFATDPGAHDSPDQAPPEVSRVRMHDGGVSRVSATPANEAIETGTVSGYRYSNVIPEGSRSQSGCAPRCNPVANVIRPLPGVLDPRAFERARVDLGRCDICKGGKAVYRSRAAQADLCEVCYSRLVRERNGRAGVR